MNKFAIISGLIGCCIGLVIGLVPLSVAEAEARGCGGNGKFQAVAERFTDYQAMGVFVVDTCSGDIITAKRYDYSSLPKH